LAGGKDHRSLLTGDLLPLLKGIEECQVDPQKHKETALLLKKAAFQLYIQQLDQAKREKRKKNLPYIIRRRTLAGKRVSTLPSEKGGVFQRRTPRRRIIKWDPPAGVQPPRFDGKAPEGRGEFFTFLALGMRLEASEGGES